MVEFDCRCKCDLKVDASDKDEAEQLAAQCLEGEEEVCEDIDCLCDCEEE
jgi:hypothetical protein